MPVQLPEGYSALSFRFRHTLDPDPWWITFGMTNTSFVGDMAELGDLAMTTFMASFGDQLSNAVTLEGCQIRLGDGTNSPPITFVSKNQAGTNTDAKLPQNCALLITKQTLLGGRKHRGRFFVPGVLSEGEVDAVGSISSGNLTSLQTDATTWLTALEESEELMVILHADEGEDTPLPTTVNSLVVSSRISTQRRRLR